MPVLVEMDTGGAIDLDIVANDDWPVIDGHIVE
jgi:hypothetical protein